MLIPAGRSRRLNHSRPTTDRVSMLNCRARRRVRPSRRFGFLFLHSAREDARPPADLGAVLVGRAHPPSQSLGVTGRASRAIEREDMGNDPVQDNLQPPVTASNDPVLCVR